MSRFETFMIWTGGALILALAGFAAGVWWFAPGRGGLAVAVLLFLAVVAALVAAQQFATRTQDTVMADEREQDLDQAAERLGYRTLEAAVFLTIGGVLLDLLSTPTGTVIALVAAVTAAGIARTWGAVWMARRG